MIHNVKMLAQAKISKQSTVNQNFWIIFITYCSFIVKYCSFIDELSITASTLRRHNNWTYYGGSYSKVALSLLVVSYRFLVVCAFFMFRTLVECLSKLYFKHNNDTKYVINIMQSLNKCLN